MKVRELMTRSVAICRREDGLDAAVRTMKERVCGCVVVADDRQRPVGIVTDRDACLAALRYGKALHELPVSAAMSSPVTTCSFEDEVAGAESTMARFQVRRLPVVERGGRIVGIVSVDDIARRAVADRDLFARPVRSEDVGMTLGEIARPHIVVEEPLAR